MRSHCEEPGVVEPASSELPSFPQARTSPFDPPATILELLERQPISKVRLWNGLEVFLVTRYEDVKAVLQNRAFSSDVRQPGYPKMSDAFAEFTEGLLNHMDPPEHNVYRRMLAPEFMVKRVERLRDEVQAMVDELLDRMEEHGGPVDLVEALAFPVPATVTCALLGVPYSDKEFFVTCAETFLGGQASVEAASDARRQLRGYLSQLIERKLSDPTDDVLGYMATEYLAKGEVTHEALTTLAELMLIAGFDTTANMIALGLLALFEHLSQLEALKRNPELIPGAVEELLRYLTITHRGRHRVAIEDVEIGGVTIRAGEGVICAQDAANRDPEVFDHPNRLDVTRPDAKAHLAFGHGIHQCLGANLARLELQVVYATILRRMPKIHVAVPLEELHFKHDAMVYGVTALPVAW